MPRNLSVIVPRSFCPECGSSIAWRDNIPLFSFVFLRGRCRHCAKPIGFRYPAVEFTTAVIFGVLVWIYGWNLIAWKWVVFESLLTVLFWTDLEERLLLDEFTLGGTALGLVLSFFIAVPGPAGTLFSSLPKLPWQSLLNSLVGACLLSAPMWLLAALYARLRKREGLGLGDVKLLLLFGAFLGIEHGLVVLLIGSVAGSVAGIILAKVARKEVSTYELPFGSFLCVSAASIPFWNRTLQ